jgi:Ino eighty subunit 2
MLQVDFDYATRHRCATGGGKDDNVVLCACVATTDAGIQDEDGDIKMEAQEQPPKPLAPAVCNVDGCTATRKYRLVRDSERGACGMGHLHLLETQPRAVAA